MKTISRSLLFCFSSISFAHAAGFQILEQNSTYLGQAYSGTASGTENASTSYYNPAASLHMNKGHYFSNSVALIAPTAEYTVNSSTVQNAGPVTDLSVATDKAKSIQPVPGLMYSYKQSDSLAFNAALVAPFGLSINYPEDSRLRYFGIESMLEAIALMPSVAVGDKKFSVACGPIFAKARIRLSQIMNIDLLSGPQYEHFYEQAASAFAYGWQAGLHYEGPRAKVGLAFKSSLALKAFGEVRTTIPTGTKYTEISANSPSYYTLSGEYKLNDKVKVLADFSRTRWSSFDVLEIKLRRVFNSSTFSNGDVTEGFKDVNRYALGVNYLLTDQQVLRAGFAVDESPTTDAHRNVRIPDSTRSWYSAGLSYKTHKGTIDIGYSFVKMRDTSVSEVNDLGYSVDVDYKSHVHILGIQWNYNWS